MPSEAAKIENAKALIGQAAKEEHLDDALAIVMEAAGITSGDVAGQFFSEFDDEYEHWETADEGERLSLLDRYLKAEAAYVAA